MRQPIYDNDGSIVVGKKKIVVYDIETSGSNRTLKRREGIQVNTGAFTLNETNTIATDLKEFNYRLAKSTAVVPKSGSLSLPGTVTTAEPTAGKIRLLSIKSSNPPINLTKDGQTGSSRGIPALTVTTYQTQLVVAALIATITNPLPAVDLLYEVDERTTSNSDKSVDANQLKVWITVKGRDDQPDSILTATGTMRNAK